MSSRNLRSELAEKMIEYLRAQGIDGTSELTGRPLAEEVANVVLRDCLDRTPGGEKNLTPPFDYLIGFAFGHRFQDNGNRVSGPINERLAGVLVKEYGKQAPEKRPEVWAQWEIADCLRGTCIEKDGKLKPVYPDISIRLDQVNYTSTVAVMKKIKAGITPWNPAHLPAALVIAHPDQLRRCVRVAGSFGFRAQACVHSTDLADWYDAGSGQLWARLRHLYILHDMLGSLSLSRDEAVERAMDKSPIAQRHGL